MSVSIIRILWCRAWSRHRPGGEFDAYAQKLAGRLGLSLESAFLARTDPGYHHHPHIDQTGSLKRVGVLYIVGSERDRVIFPGIGREATTPSGVLVLLDPQAVHEVPESQDQRYFLRMDFC